METRLATIADSYSLKRGPAKPPISTHPAFPAIVALWFSALLGLGSLVLPIALLERLVSVTGIASLVPSAAPPLGFTAHAGIALAGAIAGAMLGLLLARKIAQAHASEPSARQFSVEKPQPRRPISAHDELGEEGLAPAFGTAPPLLAQKRRSLAMDEDNRRSTYLETVPLPGHSAAAPADSPTIGVEPAMEDRNHVIALSAEPLELGDFTDLDDPAESVEADPALEALRSRIHTPVEPTFQDQPMTDSYSFDPSNDRGDEAERQEFQPFATIRPARDALDPLPFAAPSLRRLEPVSFDEDEVGEYEGAASPGESGPQLSVVELDEPDFDAEVAADRPLDELGLVQLAARLGASLRKRKARFVPPEQSAPVPVVAAIGATEDFEAAGAEDAARAIADFFASGNSGEVVDETVDGEPEAQAPAIPAPLRGFSVEADDDGEDEAFTASFSLPLGTASASAPTPDERAEVDEELDETDEEDGDYSSLLAMKNPFARQQEFVRVEEPEIEDGAFEPTVTFPQPPAPKPDETAAAPAGPSSRPFDPPRVPAASAAPRDPRDAERSLRDALATLQRMSGAA
jgi:hypothetical protein